LHGVHGERADRIHTQLVECLGGREIGHFHSSQK
jgi:hypothetical protein